MQLALRTLIPVFVLCFAMNAAPPSDVPLAELAKWKPVRMPFDGSRYTERERSMINHMVEASRMMEDIYWRQSDPEGLKLYLSTKDPQLKRALMINGSRYDLINENKPFANASSAPPGRNLYPAGLSRAQIEEYVKKHPEKRAEIYSGYTVVRWKGSGLVGIPYSKEFKPFIDKAAAELRAAASSQRRSGVSRSSCDCAPTPC